MKILDIGPGRHPIPGADALTPTVMRGRRLIRGKRFICRWGFDPIPARDAAYDLVHATHVLEHIPWSRTHRALCEAYRVLRPGGRIELWVPDFAQIAEWYRRRQCGDELVRHNRQQCPMRWVQVRIFGHADEGLFHHGACFDEPYLRHCLLRVGFSDPVRLPDDRARVPQRINLGMEARKP